MTSDSSEFSLHTPEGLDTMRPIGTQRLKVSMLFSGRNMGRPPKPTEAMFRGTPGPKGLAKIEKALNFTPKYKVVPPVNELAWGEGHAWARHYAKKGFDALIEAERQEIAHRLNVPELTKDDCDAGLMYALVWNEFTFDAVNDFFQRRDTRLAPMPDNLRALYDRCLDQIRALAVQHIELTPRSETLAAIVEAFKHKPVAIQEQNDLFLTTYYLSQMIRESFPLLTATIKTDNFPYIERTHFGFLGIRLRVAVDLAQQYCLAREYPHVPDYEGARKTVRLADRGRMVWLLDPDLQIRDDQKRSVKVVSLHRNWFIDHGLWIGGKAEAQAVKTRGGARAFTTKTELPLSLQAPDERNDTPDPGATA